MAEKTENTVKTITLGCRLNLHESEVMAGHARDQGLTDSVIINTCAVTNEAVRQGRQTIRRAARENPDAKIIVTGCAAQVDPDTYADMEMVDHVLGNDEKMRAESFAPTALTEKVNLSDIMAVKKPAGSRAGGLIERSRAIVQVQNGCDHRCTFCIIPFGRGNSRSVPAEDVVRRVAELRADGFNEIVLTGVDISSWGEDLPENPLLGNLVARILKTVPDLPRLRLSSIDSAEVDDELFEIIASEPRFAPYLHLSLQHGDNMILKRMKRRHSREDAISLCQRLREVRPDISYGADIIAGFPTETEAMFENSLALIEECDLAWLHVFPFSARQGTPAARMPQLNGSIIKERAARLRRAGNISRERHFKKRLGQIDTALIEAGGKEFLKGRMADFSPVVLPLYKGGEIKPGELHRVHITGYDAQNLLGDFA
ncbi:MAG: tRNA (N(6)-L-threonylcarbamoyladenosine(37)-C(2))-methylthiotransferase MtaB [Acidimicrobiales bacterium]|nr:tRNA (N(6)-L-threonylcarbamoyladenosine(37)-C(2))-methylthiotransferase MtaB [Hyphomonadaceae bacterium]RZV44594.1 MAG: tRNA (N(6)-L-threonylcarbamoyladenosine(37)-C(2))-methylthiotransferase MtaB [Acidimicrobiales bacterium]